MIIHFVAGLVIGMLLSTLCISIAIKNIREDK